MQLQVVKVRERELVLGAFLRTLFYIKINRTYFSFRHNATNMINFVTRKLLACSTAQYQDLVFLF